MQSNRTFAGAAPGLSIPSVALVLLVSSLPLHAQQPAPGGGASAPEREPRGTLFLGTNALGPAMTDVVLPDPCTIWDGPCGVPGPPDPPPPPHVSKSCIELPLVNDRCPTWTSPPYDSGADGPDAPGGLLTHGRVTATRPQGDTVYTLGTSDGRYGPDLDYDLVLLAHYAGSGSLRWVQRVRGPSSRRYAYAVALTVSPDGSQVFVTGGLHPTLAASNGAAITVAFDAVSGATQWSREDLPAWSQGVSVRDIESDGTRVFITGGAQSSAGAEALTIAYDASSGATLWSQRHASPMPEGSSASSLATSPDGSRVYVGGTYLGVIPPSTVLRAKTPFLLAYDAGSGSLAWQTDTGPDVIGNPWADLAVSADGNSIVAATGGAPAATSQDFELMTIAYDASSGAQRWLNFQRGGYGKTSFDSTWFNGPLRLSPDGTRAYVAGYSTSLTNPAMWFDYIVVAYDVATGTRLWHDRYEPGMSNWFPVLEVAPDGGAVYLAGYGRIEANNDVGHYVTLAYDAATGTRSWSALWSRHASFGNGLAVSPDSQRVYVSGFTSLAVDGSYADISVIAYDAD